MDQYLLIPFLGGLTSIYQLFWCSPGVQGFDTLPCVTCDITMLQLYTVMCHAMLWYVHNLVGGFTHFLWLSIQLRIIIPTDFNWRTHIFQRGWNYQPVTDYNYYNCRSIDFWPSMTIPQLLLAGAQARRFRHASRGSCRPGHWPTARFRCESFSASLWVFLLGICRDKNWDAMEYMFVKLT